MSDHARLRVVTFLSDYGTADEYVGVCHLVIARAVPGVRVIDLGHGFEGIAAGAAALAHAVPYAPIDAVHLAVVDPSVGTNRRAVALESVSGALLAGPDNGLLVPAARALGGVARAVELPRATASSATFHGRDVFAPAAARLAAGEPLEALGAAIAADSLVELPEPSVRSRPGVLESDVLRADRFGNLQLAATAHELEGAVTVNGVAAVVGRTFADAPPGGLVVLIDSSGHVAVAANQADARAILGNPAIVRIQATTNAKS